jgi:hypothetical protein
MPIKVASPEQRDDIGALARWENEGGKGRDTPVVPAGGCVGGPSLPAGHSSQVAWGFHGPNDGLLYEFFRVYGPPQERNGLGPICRIDEDRSYWLTVFRSSEDPVRRPLVCRWLDYQQARKLAGRKLAFRRFSSPVDMRGELPALLWKGGSGPEGVFVLTKLVQVALPS